MNSRSFCGLLAVFALALVVLGFIRFSVDTWRFAGAVHGGATNVRLSYAGLVLAGANIGIFIGFLLLFRASKH